MKPPNIRGSLYHTITCKSMEAYGDEFRKLFGRQAERQTTAAV
jgi:hypothetical protein